MLSVTPAVLSLGVAEVMLMVQLCKFWNVKFDVFGDSLMLMFVRSYVLRASNERCPVLLDYFLWYTFIIHLSSTGCPKTVIGNVTLDASFSAHFLVSL